MLNQAGQKLLHRVVPSEPAALLEALAPFRGWLVIAAGFCHRSRCALLTGEVKEMFGQKS